MGQRGRGETLAQVIVELMRQHTVNQADLARKLEVSTRTVRSCILDLTAAGMPIERQEDHPHVYYSVPRHWIPQGTVLAYAELREIVRILSRVPSEASRRDAVAARLGSDDPWRRTTLALEDSVTPSELVLLEQLEDSALDRCALSTSYYSVTRGSVERRTLSCQRIAYHERPIRFLAMCHYTQSLKWFRLDRLHAAALDESTPYLAAEEDQVEDVLRNTLLDFHAPGEPIECRFVVHAPEHRWFVPRLGKRARTEPAGEFVRVIMHTSAVRVLARELVGLGGAVRVETEELRAEVRALAEAALRGNP